MALLTVALLNTVPLPMAWTCALADKANMSATITSRMVNMFFMAIYFYGFELQRRNWRLAVNQCQVFHRDDSFAGLFWGCLVGRLADVGGKNGQGVVSHHAPGICDV